MRRRRRRRRRRGRGRRRRSSTETGAENDWQWKETTPALKSLRRARRAAVSMGCGGSPLTSS